MFYERRNHPETAAGGLIIGPKESHNVLKNGPNALSYAGPAPLRSRDSAIWVGMKLTVASSLWIAGSVFDFFFFFESAASFDSDDDSAGWFCSLVSHPAAVVCSPCPFSSCSSLSVLWGLLFPELWSSSSWSCWCWCVLSFTISARFHLIRIFKRSPGFDDNFTGHFIDDICNKIMTIRTRNFLIWYIVVLCRYMTGSASTRFHFFILINLFWVVFDI